MSKKKFPTPNPPRVIEELNRLYSQAISKIGENQLHIKRLNAQNKQILAEVEILEAEGRQRQAIDKQAAEAVAKEEPQA